LNNASRTTRRELIYIIKNENKDPLKVKHVINEVKAAGGIEYANEKMLKFRDEALAMLSTFNNGEIIQALEELVRFTTDRKH
ncbi:MAG: polyprenyl synthetase family protein, partial [Chitinophagaceae bacterium]|nr:polyprenyl synthetase family protein [Chitinophagaceae bacterium]